MTVEEFVTGLRRLRRWSGLTYRQLAARARESGDFLPASTVASALSRTSLPREELVASFVRACGQDEATVQEWLAVRRALAAGTESSALADGPEPPATNEGRVGSVDAGEGGGTATPLPARTMAAGRAGASRRRLVPVLALAMLAVPAGLVGWAVNSGERPSAAESHPAPLNGGNRIRSTVTDLCLSEVAGSDTGHLTLANCATSHPDMSLRRLPDGTYQIETDHPKFGAGCTGVEEANPSPGALLADSYCGQRGVAEQFRLHPVTEPVAGYRLELVHSGLCMTIPSPGAAGTPPRYAVQQPCRTDNPEQIFTFTSPVP
ncbi:hypothetical protein E1193_01845 [Micromonospora sp. KC606]|uniref:helix-turn-helix domain-containing protein n=1 Tax=Micromonospora sp. KC606 TaxID=2530379 RepID=UPI00104D6A76|nr:helix-turn-helix domain-containing protein [Micromonospora sp. KC606]TDC85810.1 hypothetical protein E1193_01845 [Micromonospora sp. KC606]